MSCVPVEWIVLVQANKLLVLNLINSGLRCLWTDMKSLQQDGELSHQLMKQCHLLKGTASFESIAVLCREVTMWDLRFSQQYFWGFRSSEMWCLVVGWVLSITLKDIMLSSVLFKQRFLILWRNCFPSHYCELLSQQHSIAPGRAGCLLCWFQWPHSLNVCPVSGGLASTVGSLWVWLPLGPWMCVSMLCVFWLSYAGRGIALGCEVVPVIWNGSIVSEVRSELWPA